MICMERPQRQKMRESTASEADICPPTCSHLACSHTGFAATLYMPTVGKTRIFPLAAIKMKSGISFIVGPTQFIIGLPLILQKLRPIDSINQLVEIVSDEVFDAFVSGRRRRSCKMTDPSAKKSNRPSASVSYRPSIWHRANDGSLSSCFHAPLDEKWLPPIIVRGPKERTSRMLFRSASQNLLSIPDFFHDGDS